jgi:hypothetical protein
MQHAFNFKISWVQNLESVTKLNCRFIDATDFSQSDLTTAAPEINSYLASLGTDRKSRVCLSSTPFDKLFVKRLLCCVKRIRNI